MRTIETNTGGALFEKQPKTLAEIVGVHQLVRNAESGTVRASLWHCIVVGAHQLVRNAEHGVDASGGALVSAL